MSPFTFTLRGLLFLNLLSVSTLTFSACTDLPNYDPNTGKITIPCLKVPVTQPFVGTQIQTFSINLNQRSGGAYVFDLDLNTVKQVTDSTPQIPIVTPVPTTQYKIGNRGPAGGIVFNVDNTGLHGLEAQAADYGSAPGLIWADAIAAAQSYGTGWHLPTKDELNLLYQQSTVVGGFANTNYDYYWSSTEFDASNAWVQTFSSGFQNYNHKGRQNLVRAVRAF